MSDNSRVFLYKHKISHQSRKFRPYIFWKKFILQSWKKINTHMWNPCLVKFQASSLHPTQSIPVVFFS